jgi:hypothetical protein
MSININEKKILDLEILLLDAWAVKDLNGDIIEIQSELEDCDSDQDVSQIVKGYMVSGGVDSRNLCESLFEDFYENKDDIYDLLNEHDLIDRLNDLT